MRPWSTTQTIWSGTRRGATPPPAHATKPLLALSDLYPTASLSPHTSHNTRERQGYAARVIHADDMLGNVTRCHHSPPSRARPLPLSTVSRLSPSSLPAVFFTRCEQSGACSHALYSWGQGVDTRAEGPLGGARPGCGSRSHTKLPLSAACLPRKGLPRLASSPCPSLSLPSHSLVRKKGMWEDLRLAHTPIPSQRPSYSSHLAYVGFRDL
jgi:hypothetical protein